jgi:predicted dehydrogenase
MTRIAVIGCGYWGKNHVRTLHQLGVLAAVCDETEAGRIRAQELAGGVPVFDRVEHMLDQLPLDGAVIATPAETHARLAIDLLTAGLDLLVEKPLALDLASGRQVLETANRHERILAVGHVLEYHPGIVRLRELVESGELGTVRYVYSNRLNLGKIRHEENILWSFAPHDISIILRLIGRLPIEVVATGGSYVQPNIADVTVTQMLFDNGVRGHIFVSWLHPYKEQKLIVVGSKRMAVFDDVAKRLDLYDQRVDWDNGVPCAVKGERTEIPFDSAEPLMQECRAFVEAIETRQPPLTDGRSALEVLTVLAAAQRSLSTQGTSVQLPWDAADPHSSSSLPDLLTSRHH